MENIEVGVWCGRLKTVPKVFVWKNRRYEVKKVTIEIERKDGNKKYKCFGIETDGMVAELRWNMTNLSWQLLVVSI